jgi:hypothetical protein
LLNIFLDSATALRVRRRRESSPAVWPPISLATQRAKLMEQLEAALALGVV